MLSNQRKSIAAESVTDGMGRPLSRCGAGVAIFSDFSSAARCPSAHFGTFSIRNSKEIKSPSFACQVQQTLLNPSLHSAIPAGIPAGRVPNSQIFFFT